MKTISVEQFIEMYGDDAYESFGEPVKEKQGIMGEVKSRISQVGKNIQSKFKGEGEFAGQSTPRRATGIVSDVFSTPLGLAKDVLPEPLEKGMEKVGEGLGKGMQWLAQKTTPEFMTTFVTKYPKTAKVLEEALGTTANVGAISGEILGAQGALNVGRKGVQTAQKAGSKISSKMDEAIDAGEQAILKGKGTLGPPPPTPEKAVGQVLGGKDPGDITTGLKAFKNVDTTGVKTYQELGTKIGESIKNLSGKVDEALDNTAPVMLKDLAITGTTTAGKKVSVDVVSRAIQHLEKAYKAIGDDVSAKNMIELLKKSKAQGLTRLEVNNLARKYGMEFGEKAFSKTGEALTSVNAKMFESTRKALKQVARQGLKGKVAEGLDDSISSLYRVQGLVKKNISAVEKLTRKIQERGLLEQAGYYAAKGVDILTGGTLRGLVGGLLPRGVGYKIMNALDLEKSLQRNLEIIQKALKSDEYLNKLLKKGQKTTPGQ